MDFGATSTVHGAAHCVHCHAARNATRRVFLAALGKGEPTHQECRECAFVDRDKIGDPIVV